MMEELDQFIQFLIDHISDDRISLSKKMKYGFRHYHLLFVIDAEPEDNSNKNSYMSRFNGSVEIVFDNRNRCIEVFDHLKDDSIMIEDSELMDKWNPILEEIVNQNIGSKVVGIMENAIASCYRKDLHREYKIKFLDIEEDDDDDESNS